ncbi:xanthine dehydrogenase family protein [bacterium]|nr:xanthine dehydrogenase family protein [bacterium]
MSERISMSVERVDAREKIYGEALYIGDYRFEDMLFAKTVRSKVPRAKILNVKIPALPDGYFVVDRDDVPGKNRVKILVYDQPYFADGVVNYIGEPILLVVGPEREKVFEIARKVEVEYEEIPPILTIDDALSGKNQPIYGDDNCFVDYHYEKGNVKNAFANAETIVEGEYETGYQEHLYIEPQGVAAVFDGEKITIYGSMQCPYYIKRALAECLALDEKNVRVVQVTTGGAFGGKEEYPSLIAGQAAVAAMKTQKPVKLILDRTEDIMVSTKRHPSRTRYRAAIDADGKVIALDVDIIFDGGAYAGLSDVVLQRGMFSAAGVYNIPNISVHGRAVATNKVPTGAFRGFGAPQVFFAIERLFDKIASKLGENPVDLRLRHAISQGDFTATGGIMRQPVKIPEMVEKLEKMSDFRSKIGKSLPGDEPHIKRGYGLSLFFHGCGFTGNGENIIAAEAKLKKHSDGKVEILVANTEMGQGALTALRKIVAETLKIQFDDVIYELPDTDRVPDSGPTVASRTTMIVGGLLKKAAEEMRERWNEADEFEIMKKYHHPDYIRWNQETFEGDAYPTYSFGANVAEVDVDTITGEIAVRHIWAVFDVGITIDEVLMRGQAQGGVVQGTGYATIEVMEAQAGRLLQSTITDYTIPTTKDVPLVECAFIDNPYEYGPFGAKCAGELTLVGAAPAIAAAVENAIGREIVRIPIKPEEIIKKLD